MLPCIIIICLFPAGENRQIHEHLLKPEENFQQMETKARRQVFDFIPEIWDCGKHVKFCATHYLLWKASELCLQGESFLPLRSAQLLKMEEMSDVIA